MRQASAFILLSLTNHKKHSIIKRDICNVLLTNINEMERSFELGEVLIALNDKCPQATKVILSQQKQMYMEILHDKTPHKLNNIFKYNWHAKLLLSLYNNDLTNSTIKKHYKLVLEDTFKIINLLNETSETNYLAVALECILSLKVFINNNNTLHELNKYSFKLFYLLQTRFKNGLYVFKNKDARIDITNHVLNGIINV